MHEAKYTIEQLSKDQQGNRWLEQCYKPIKFKRQ